VGWTRVGADDARRPLCRHGMRRHFALPNSAALTDLGRVAKSPGDIPLWAMIGNARRVLCERRRIGAHLEIAAALMGDQRPEQKTCKTPACARTGLPLMTGVAWCVLAAKANASRLWMVSYLTRVQDDEVTRVELLIRAVTWGLTAQMIVDHPASWTSATRRSSPSRPRAEFWPAVRCRPF